MKHSSVASSREVKPTMPPLLEVPLPTKNTKCTGFGMDSWNASSLIHTAENQTMAKLSESLSVHTPKSTYTLLLRPYELVSTAPSAKASRSFSSLASVRRKAQAGCHLSAESASTPSRPSWSHLSITASASCCWMSTLQTTQAIPYYSLL